MGADEAAAGRGDVVVACALEVEARALRELERDGVRVVACGMGRARTERAARHLLEPAPRALLAVGFCGALRRDLRRGEVVIAERVVDAATGAVVDADPALLAAAGAGWHGTLVTAASLAGTPEARAALPGDAVDLESAVLALAAERCGVPFLALRAVTDRAGDRLPDLEGVLDGLGRPRRRALAGMAARRPLAVLPALVRLGLGARAAARSLPAAVARLLETLA